MKTKTDVEDLKTGQKNWSYVYIQDLNDNMFSETFLLSGIVFYIDRNFTKYRVIHTHTHTHTYSFF